MNALFFVQIEYKIQKLMSMSQSPKNADLYHQCHGCRVDAWRWKGLLPQFSMILVLYNQSISLASWAFLYREPKVCMVPFD